MYEAQAALKDNLTTDYECPKCGSQAQVEVTREEFRPGREQVVGWQEWGSRVLPKVERAHHTFENVQIDFESEEATNG